MAIFTFVSDVDRRYKGHSHVRAESLHSQSVGVQAKSRYPSNRTDSSLAKDTSLISILPLSIVGISIVDSDLTTDIVEPADFNRYVRL